MHWLWACTSTPPSALFNCWLDACYLSVQHCSTCVLLFLEFFVSFFSVEKGSIRVLFHRVSTRKSLQKHLILRSLWKKKETNRKEKFVISRKTLVWLYLKWQQVSESAVHTGLYTLSDPPGESSLISETQGQGDPLRAQSANGLTHTSWPRNYRFDHTSQWSLGVENDKIHRIFAPRSALHLQFTLCWKSWGGLRGWLCS